MIPLFKVFMPDNISNGMEKILYSGQLSYGFYTKQFEKELGLYIGHENILAISGNSILFALKLLNIKPEDEVIISPMSCLMTTQPIKYVGAKVVWADIDPLTGSLDPEDVEKKITKNTKAIIHYHWAGNPGYIDEINSIAKKNGITVIEDATESFGAEYKGKKIGNTNTDIICYSFTPVRLPNALDGGGLTINNHFLYKKALLMRDLGINRENFRDEYGEISENCNVESIGDSSSMNNISGYVGLSQMPFIDTLIKKQRENALFWDKYFEDSKNIRALKKRDGINPSYWAYTILCDNRDELLVELRKKGIYASKIHLRNDLYSVFNSTANEFKGLNDFSNKQLNLPCGWWVNKKEIINCLMYK